MEAIAIDKNEEKREIKRKWSISTGKEIADMLKKYWGLKGKSAYEQALELFSDVQEKEKP